MNETASVESGQSFDGAIFLFENLNQKVGAVGVWSVSGVCKSHNNFRSESGRQFSFVGSVKTVCGNSNYESESESPVGKFIVDSSTLNLKYPQNSFEIATDINTITHISRAAYTNRLPLVHSTAYH